MSMAGRYIDVVVEEHDALPEGCEMRFHAVGPDRSVRRIRYEPLSGPEGEFEVETESGAPAHAAPVDDSGAGTAILIHGDARGLRLRRMTDGGAPADPIAEPYLLLTEDALLD
jgi:hypothetical protein